MTDNARTGNNGREGLTVYRCPHGHPVATRKPDGTWLLHGYGGCVPCFIGHMKGTPWTAPIGSTHAPGGGG